MKFIAGIFKVLKDTTWPTRKQVWRDYIAILEYTAFFTVIIFIFDKLLTLGLIELINIF
ncbi:MULTISPECIES: preprotein translocase subunit SecE [Streptococcus]|uniref:Preprotein translocase subunit SecE n=1 Tax=Streptococcus porcorum TaxID=701526 RepID=A0ABV2JG45_9STRE|nr:preprotein translocase subunit SecE [Streptococcus sp.]MDY3824062.1 preprotein translocase subunit SecE [Streptococcus sp.]